MSNKMGVNGAGILVIVLCTMMSGCKAGPAKEPAGFVNGQEMTKQDDMPFNSAWVKPGFDKLAYNEVYIAPVNTDYIMEQNWWKESMRYGKIKRDAQDIARFTQKTFIDAVKSDPNRRFKVAKEPDEDTLIVEIAITELTPNKPFLKLGAFAPFAGPVVALLNSSNLSTVAFEARIRDGATGEIVAMFADRETEQLYVVTAKHFTWYAHAHGIITAWAQQFVELANRQPGTIVKDTKTFELLPWK